MNLYDDLDDWEWDGDELPGGNVEESVDSSEGNNISSGDLSTESPAPWSMDLWRNNFEMYISPVC